MADSVFQQNNSRTPRKIGSWLSCLLRGRTRRLQRRHSFVETVAARVEHLEDRTLLTAAAFGAGTAITLAASGASDVKTADIDGDGDLDVIVSSANNNTVSWWENTAGDGSSFTEHVVSNAVGGARSIFTGDIDGDGDLDIVTAAENDDTITWWENTAGDGSTFTAHEVSTTVDGVRSIFVVDLDGDGDADIVSASFLGDTIEWHENTAGDGSTFTKHDIAGVGGNGFSSVTVADIDHDGDLDVIATSSLDDTLTFFENTAGNASAFTATTLDNLADGATSVVAADIDGDGKLDLVVTEGDSGNVSWYRNDGQVNPTFTKDTLATGETGASDLFAIDIDHDGDIDILVASADDDEITLYENDGNVNDPIDPQFTARVLSTSENNISAVTAADIDGDGDYDIFSSSRNDNTVTLIKNESIHRNAAFADSVTISNVTDGAYSVATGDIDGDGRVDIAVSSVFDGTIRWFRNNGEAVNPTFTTNTVGASNGPREIYLADIDGDGDLDIAAAVAVANTVGWWRNNGGGNTWTFVAVNGASTAVQSVFAADVDGDGDIDLLSASSGDDTIRWFENDGAAAPTFTTHVISGPLNNSPVDGAFSITAADVDGDGDLDVIVASYDDNRIAWYENLFGDGSAWSRRLLSITAVGARSVTAADVDNDGDIDIIAASELDHTVRWFENDGSADPSFTTHILSTGEQGVQQVVAADLDNDGDIDILTVAKFADPNDTSRIARFMNDGAIDPTFTRMTIDTKNNRPTSVAVGDFDDDGDLDVVSTSIQDDTVSLYQNIGDQLSLATENTAPAEIVAGQFDDVFKIVAQHNGRPGDSDIELNALRFRFERSAGVPFLTTEVNDLLFNVKIFVDDGDGIFKKSDDILTMTIDPLGLDQSGDMTFNLPNGDARFRFSAGDSRTYFIVVEPTANAFLLNSKTFRITHLAESDGVAKDLAANMPAGISFSGTNSTSLINVGEPTVPVPLAPVITGPIGTTTDTTPTIRWSVPQDAEQYNLRVIDVATGNAVIVETGLTDPFFTPTTPLQVGKTYQVLVQAVNVSGEVSPLSDPEFFSVDPLTTPPPTPVITGPIGTISGTVPTITWTASAGATDYDLLVYNTRLGREVLGPKGLFGTSFTSNISLPPDEYQVFVRANNGLGESPWSKSLFFKTALAPGQQLAPQVTGPIGAIPDNTPTITWTAYPGAVSYELLVYHVNRGQEVLNIKGITGTQFTTPSLFVPGTYQVFVRAILGGGAKTIHSKALLFDVTSATPVPGVTQILTPTQQTDDSTPTITWQALQNAATYDILVYDVNAGEEVFSAFGLTTHFATLPTPLSPGHYQAHVRGSNAAGQDGDWTKGFDIFIVSKPGSANAVEGTTQLITPSSPTTDGTPTITWQALKNAATYDILIYDVNAGQEVFRAFGLTTHFTTLIKPLPPGHYQIHVRGVNAAGQGGAWSGAFNMFIVAQNDNTNDQKQDNNLLPKVAPFAESETSVVAFYTDINETEFNTHSTEQQPTEEQVTVKQSTETVPAANTAMATDVVMSTWSETDWWATDSTTQKTDLAETHAEEEPAIDNTTEPQYALLSGAFFGLTIPLLRWKRAARKKKSSN